MDRKPTTGENIFFHETTCSSSGLVHLNSRQACAIESAARLNPDRHVYVLFASPVGFRDDSHLPKTIEALKTYPNVHLRNNNLWRYVQDTPLEAWLSDGALFESKYLHEHMSDVLRYVTLYKFGGMYLDLDVVVQRNFDDLGKNFAGDDSDIAIGCGVMHFDTDQLGRELSEECLRFLLNHFNGEIFIDNGPLVLTETLERLCETRDRKLMTREQCKGFRVYPRSVFYAVSWERWKLFFDVSMTNTTLQLTKNSTVIHVWNDMSKKIIVRIGSHTAYEVAAKINCPRVYETRLNFEYF
ncbi:lactosylceramide 4-alpha-galactosyltransferase-like [Bradysia coprophila]|uniref:lactosylceramide 4-alpha-galactosyltransferase-like n=1 Tax=Bradysia coprophila TaxID=38358 RepID=UPI00187D8137|nr:lactosylceramide 4-alpha-galactosyltransferase-like [Bradysia coprophila]